METLIRALAVFEWASAFILTLVLVLGLIGNMRTRYAYYAFLTMFFVVLILTGVNMAKRGGFFEGLVTLALSPELSIFTLGVTSGLIVGLAYVSLSRD